MRNPISSLSLFWKTLLSTSLGITVLFGLTGWIVQDTVVRLTSASLEEEVRSSFQAYESLWRARAEMLGDISTVLSRMPDVRAAFSTGDRATIADTAREIWSGISREDAVFLVTDPSGAVIASLGGSAPAIRRIDPVRSAAAHFPKQASGFLIQSGKLYQVVITPVYVSSPRGPLLLNVLVAGYTVDSTVAQSLKQATGGSDFVFTAANRVIASSFPQQAEPPPETPGATYSTLTTPLLDIDGKALGQLRIYRAFDAARQHLATLQQSLVWIWAIAVALGIALSYLLARRIVRPVERLDIAAGEITRGNYDYRVEIESQNEFGRLAKTFNQMCASLRNAREELIRHERIATIGRLSTSLVHDLRNPLAAIYGGAEMLVDSQLTEAQVKRLAANIYRSSRRIQELLQELVDVARGSSEHREAHRLCEIIAAAIDSQTPVAGQQGVAIESQLPFDLEIAAERGRLERVFVNLIGNAIEAMPAGGRVKICAERLGSAALVTVEDTGPGIAPEIAARLFEPFVTAGKKNGLGLGLALSRQTVLEHGGDLWADSSPGRGARFHIKLPLCA